MSICIGLEDCLGSVSACLVQGPLIQEVRLMRFLHGAKCRNYAEREACLQAALGLGEAKVPGVTDKLLQLVMGLYRAKSSQEEQAEFLTLICRDFGVQSKLNTS